MLHYYITEAFATILPVYHLPVELHYQYIIIKRSAVVGTQHPTILFFIDFIYFLTTEIFLAIGFLKQIKPIHKTAVSEKK